MLDILLDNERRFIEKSLLNEKNELCSWMEVECLGACVNAPMIQINQDYFEDLDEIKSEEIIKLLMEDKLPKAGSSKNRKNSAPEKGKTSLLEVKNA